MEGPSPESLRLLLLPIELQDRIYRSFSSRSSVAAMRATCQWVRQRLLPLPDAQRLNGGTMRLDYRFGLPPSCSEIQLLPRECHTRNVSILGLYADKWSDETLEEVRKLFRTQHSLQRLYLNLWGEEATRAQCEPWCRRFEAEVFLRCFIHCWPNHEKRPQMECETVEPLLACKDSLVKPQLLELKEKERSVSICTWAGPREGELSVLGATHSLTLADRFRRAVLDTGSQENEEVWTKLMRGLLGAYHVDQQLGSFEVIAIVDENLPSFGQLGRGRSRREMLQIVQTLEARLLLLMGKVHAADSLPIMERVVNILAPFKTVLRRKPYRLTFAWTHSKDLPPPILRPLGGNSYRMDLVLRDSSLLSALLEELQSCPVPISELGLWGLKGSHASVRECERLYLLCPTLRRMAVDVDLAPAECWSQLGVFLEAKAVLLCLQEHRPQSDQLKRLKERSLTQISQYGECLKKSDVWRRRLNTAGNGLSFHALSQSQTALERRALMELLVNYIMRSQESRELRNQVLMALGFRLICTNSPVKLEALPTFEDLVGNEQPDDFLRMWRRCEIECLLTLSNSTLPISLFNELYDVVYSGMN